MIILLHSSKTMRTSSDETSLLRSPIFLKDAVLLNAYLKNLNTDDIAKIMKIKPVLADKTKKLIDAWTSEPVRQQPAIDAFLGDIYSGLQATSLNTADREYANKSLIILSGLYGLIRPLDGIMPYRLEMAYKLPGFRTPNLYTYWGSNIAEQIPKNEAILNLSSVEYSKVITDYVDPARIITPKFLTLHPVTKQPTFVVVHAKIARGAFAHWAIKHRLNDASDIKLFDELGYKFNETQSTVNNPVFICNEFKGLGLSVRLS